MSRKRGCVWACLAALASVLLASVAGLAQSGLATKGPFDPKARKTYEGAEGWIRQSPRLASDEFRKANKQDGGRCTQCLQRAYYLTMQTRDYKTAADILREWLPAADSDLDRAEIHFRLGALLQNEGILAGKQKCFSESCDELKTALQLDPHNAATHFTLGVSLARLSQDDAARAEFKAFLAQDKENPAFHRRAERYLDRVELARAKMAPPFSITTLDGARVAMDNLAGKVVLIDFWATWCGPCREALPHIRQIAHKFEGQPLVVLSVSLDSDQAKWKDFVEKNGMTWLQYRDGSFNGTMAKLFGVNAIPATFTIDADGVLEDQHVGDASIEGKLKKLVAQAAELASRTPPAAAPQQSAVTPPSQP